MSQEFRVNVKGIFEGISNKLLIDFDQIQAQINHDGERGEQRENALSNFLAKYLPKKYTLGSGQIIDKHGNISRQCDIVVYDAFNCPLLLAEENYQLFPVESVLGVIEVKSVLNAGTFAESVQNIQSVKKLKREEPVAGFIFGYRSGYKKEPKIMGAAQALLHANKDILPRERVDIVCVLSDGIIREYKTKPDWGETGAQFDVCVEASPSVLLLFLSWLIETLEERKSSMPSLIHYASYGIGEIGIFTSFPSTNDE